MARNNRVRVSDEEMGMIDEVAKDIWGEEAAEDIPRGKTLRRLVEYYRTGGGSNE